ncbi:MAG: hypothetical protein WD066_08105 [Planctomycetaceae bacterium]
MNLGRAIGAGRIAAWTALLAVVPPLLAGCSFPHKLRVTEWGAPLYSRVSLVYEVNAGRGALAPRFVAPPPGEIMSFPREPGSPTESAVLRLEYPHPCGDAGLAHVSVRMSRLSIEDRQRLAKQGNPLVRLVSTTDERVRDDEHDPFAEIYELAISKQELDLLLVDVARGGYFDPNLRADGGTWLSVEIDGGVARKKWLPEPRLDDIITRLHADVVMGE